jgi:hypothetical protein
MPKIKPTHHDRGDGVCDHCFEEMPCTYLATRGASYGGSTQWENEQRNIIRDRNSKISQEINARIETLFKDYGVDIEISRYSSYNANRRVQIKMGFLEALFTSLNEKGISLDDLGISPNGDLRQAV